MVRKAKAAKPADLDSALSAFLRWLDVDPAEAEQAKPAAPKRRREHDGYQGPVKGPSRRR